MRKSIYLLIAVALLLSLVGSACAPTPEVVEKVVKETVVVEKEVVVEVTKEVVVEVTKEVEVEVVVTPTPLPPPEREAQVSKQKVLLYIRKGTSGDRELMLTQEVGVMTSMLEEAGFEVIVATASGEPIEAQTTELVPDLKLADVKVNDYVGIIMPCMAKGAAPRWHAAPEEIMLVKEAVAQGKPMAAQQGGIVILAEAGILVGKKYTYYTNPSIYRSFAGAIYSGKGVIQDGNIITSSNCPYLTKYYGYEDGTSELTELFIKTIKK